MKELHPFRSCLLSFSTAAAQVEYTIRSLHYITPITPLIHPNNTIEFQPYMLMIKLKIVQQFWYLLQLSRQIQLDLCLLERLFAIERLEVIKLCWWVGMNSCIVRAGRREAVSKAPPARCAYAGRTPRECLIKDACVDCGVKRAAWQFARSRLSYYDSLQIKSPFYAESNYRLVYFWALSNTLNVLFERLLSKQESYRSYAYTTNQEHLTPAKHQI